MRVYENWFKTSENRCNPRSYYIPSGKSEYKLLNGEWDFAYFSRDIEIDGEEQLVDKAVLYIWRAPIDNDIKASKAKYGVTVWDGEYYDRIFPKVYNCNIFGGSAISLKAH